MIDFTGGYLVATGMLDINPPKSKSFFTAADALVISVVGLVGLVGYLGRPVINNQPMPVIPDKIQPNYAQMEPYQQNPVNIDFIRDSKSIDALVK